MRRCAPLVPLRCHCRKEKEKKKKKKGEAIHPMRYIDMPIETQKLPTMGCIPCPLRCLFLPTASRGKKERGEQPIVSRMVVGSRPGPEPTGEKKKKKTEQETVFCGSDSLELQYIQGAY